MEVLVMTDMKWILWAIVGILLLTITILSIMLMLGQRKTKKVESADDEIFKLLEEQETEAKTEAKRCDLESLLTKMQADLDAKTHSVESFEQEQEEKAIISYQELIAANQKEPMPNAVTIDMPEVVEDLEDIPILDVVEAPSIELPQISSIQEEKPEKKYRPNDFISPIYGKRQPPEEYTRVLDRKELEARIRSGNLNKLLEEAPKHAPRRNIVASTTYPPKQANHMDAIELEKTLNMRPLEEQMRKNDQFLNALKEFRKNLE